MRVLGVEGMGMRWEEMIQPIKVERIGRLSGEQ